MSTIHMAPGVELDENELHWEFVRSSGPGGQNVNKVASAVQLRFDVAQSPALTEEVRAWLRRLAGNRMTADGVLILESRATRSQRRNREAALEQLRDLIRRAAAPPKPRRPTRPSASAKEARLTGKARRSRKKQLRRPVDPNDTG